MREYRFLIPECLDGTDVPQPEWRWDILKQALVQLAGGYTQAGNVEGVWENTPLERSRQFIVSVTAEQEPYLFALLRELLPKFSQQAIYIAHGGESWTISNHNPMAEPEHRRWAREVLQL